jgi:hypothetical protein
MEVCRLSVLGSSSHGNCYILECAGESLIIELGIDWKDMLKQLNYKEGFEQVRGCLTSHR